MQAQERLFKLERQLAVKILVLLGGHFLFRSAPERGLLVDRLFLGAHVNRETDVVGMFVDHIFQAIFIGKLSGIFF